MLIKKDSKEEIAIRPTQELFWEKPYCFEFETKIQTMTAKNEVILTKTAFYPGGGGQPPDRGILFFPTTPPTIYQVVSVERRGSNVVHILNAPISPHLMRRSPVGASVVGQIDKARRLKLMRAHTSQHVFSAMIKKIAGIETKKVHLEVDSVTIFLKHAPENDALERALQETNAFLLEGKDVQTNVYQKNNPPKKLVSSLRGEISKVRQPFIRIVSIDSLDHSLCGGTHVKNTSEVGILFLSDVQGSVLHYSLGSLALIQMGKMNMSSIMIAKAFAAKPEENLKRVSSLLREHSSLKQIVVQLSKQLLAYQVAELKAQPLIINSIKIFSKNFELFDRKFILQQLGPLPENSIALLIIKGPFLLVLSNIKTFPANLIIQWYCDQTKLKGGGSATIAQAAVPESDRALTLALELLVNAFK